MKEAPSIHAQDTGTLKSIYVGAVTTPRAAVGLSAVALFIARRADDISDSTRTGSKTGRGSAGGHVPRGICRPTFFHPAIRLAATAAIALLLTGCAGVWERYDDHGRLVSRTTIAWSISPRIVEANRDGASVLVSDTAESMRAAGELAGTAAAAAAKGAVTP